MFTRQRRFLKRNSPSLPDGVTTVPVSNIRPIRSLTRRPNLAGVLVCFLLLASSGTTRAAPPGTTAGRIDFPTFGLSVASPAGWRRATDVTLGQVARWERGGGKQPVRASLVIEIEPGTRLTLAQRVAQLQRLFRGKVLDAHAMLDGMPAVRMKFPGSTSLPRHDVLVAKREAHMYLLELHAAMDAKTDDAWHTLLKGWKWIPFESPVGHLQLALQPVSLFDGLMTFQAPEVLRPFPLGSQTQAKLAVVDYRTDIMALDIDAQVLPNPGHLTLDQLKASYAAQVQQLLKLNTPVVWKERAGKTPFFLTDILVPNLTPPAGSPAMLYKPEMRYGLAPVNKDRLILFAFVVTVSSDEERKVYQATVDRMLDSIAVGSPRPAKPAGKTG